MSDLNTNGDGHMLTYGELRRRLESMGNLWAVDESIDDDELVPQFPTGGEQEPEGLREMAAPLEPDVDVRTLIAALPPSAPELQRRWAEEGISPSPEAAADTGDRLPGDAPSDRSGTPPGSEEAR